MRGYGRDEPPIRQRSLNDVLHPLALCEDGDFGVPLHVRINDANSYDSLSLGLTMANSKRKVRPEDAHMYSCKCKCVPRFPYKNAQPRATPQRRGEGSALTCEPDAILFVMQIHRTFRHKGVQNMFTDLTGRLCMYHYMFQSFAY